MSTDLRETVPSSPASPSSVEDETEVTVDLSDTQDLHSRIGSLQDDLDQASEEEATKRRELGLLWSRQQDLMTELRQRQDEAGRMVLEEAAKTQRALVSEAQRHAAKIRDKASTETARLIAEARERAVEIVDEGRARLEAFEAEVTGRETQLEHEHEVLDRRAAALRKHHEQMVETLKLVAEIALEQVAETQKSAHERYGAAPGQPAVIGTEVRSVRAPSGR